MAASREQAIKNLQKSKGRPKGSKDKITRDVKARVLQVWDTLQKDKKKSLLGVATEDPKWFYDTFGKALLPKDVNVKMGISDSAWELGVMIFNERNKCKKP